VFSDLAAYARFPIVLGLDTSTDRLTGELVSGNYFRLLEANPRLGRLISDDDDAPAGTGVAVISYRLWTTQFNRSPDVIGRVMPVNGRSVSIIGVAPEGFFGTNMDWDGRPDIWLPMSMQPQIYDTNLLQLPVPWHLAIGRLRKGATVDQAQVALRNISEDLTKANTRRRDAGSIATAIPINQARFFPAYRSRLALFSGSLAAISGLTLLIALFNVANLLLVRLLSRTKEFAIKLALGAKSWHLVRQVIVESSIVSLAAGAVGLWIASWTSTLLNSFPRPFQNPVELPIQVDFRLAGTALLVSVVLILALSFVPFAQLSYGRLSAFLKSENAIPRIRIARMSVLRLCILFQIAVGTVLAAAAGLSIRSVQNITAVDPGFSAEGLIESRLDLASVPPQRRSSFFSQFQKSLPALPAVASASLAGDPPTVQRIRKIRQVGDSAAIDASLSYVTAGYFKLLGTRILEGEEFSQEDNTRSVIINDVIASRYWPGQPAAGRSLHIDGESFDREVRAVVHTSKCMNVLDDNQTCLYLPLPAAAPQAVVLFKSRGDAASAISEIHNQIRQIDTNVAVYDTKTVSEDIRNRFSGQLMLGTLATILAILALVILAVGVFAIVSFTIEQTSRSIGIRIAIGATASRIVREFVLQMAVVTGIGTVAGLIGLLNLSPIIGSQLFRISPRDPLALLAAAVLLPVISLGACTLAARRVAGIDPVVTLRLE